MKLHNWLVSTLLLFTFLACAGEANPDPVEAEDAAEIEEVPTAAGLDEFRVELRELTPQYLNIKDALVESDLDAVTSAAAGFGDAFDAIDPVALDGLDRGDWERLSVDIGEHGKSIAAATDLETARRQFSLLSPAMAEAIKRFGGNEEDLYVQYCPMAFDNVGATWISANEEIRNPYFGDKMLTCGKVQEELTAN